MAGRDTVEFQQLFAPLYARCHALARRLVGTDARAEQVASEAMARAYARWSRVRSLPHPEGWVLRLTGELAAGSLAEDSRGANELGVAVAALSHPVRDVVVLRFLTELDDDEVALALGRTPESVRTAVQEGLAQLRNRVRIGGAGVSAA
jgi:RNA polymerase sigma-70 factor (ECF subfamily)